MENKITSKIKILKPASEVFDAIVDPVKIGNYWFSSSSERWQQGKNITLKYDEYGAEGSIHISEIIENQKIVFTWGEENTGITSVTITLNETDENASIIEITESGFNDNDPDIVNKLINQKGGWVYMLSCLKNYLENDISSLRASLIH